MAVRSSIPPTLLPTSNLRYEMITDRTMYDVIRVEDMCKRGWSQLTDSEKTEWLEGLKGSYNASDMNRVAEYVQYLYTVLKYLGYDVDRVVKTDWTTQDIPTAEQLTAYLDNVKALRKYVNIKFKLPDLPTSMNGLTYDGANRIERNLQLIYDYLDAIIRVHLHSKQILFYSGYAVYVAQQRFNCVGLYTNDNKEFRDSNDAKVYVRSEE